jgi:hypothetical protein
MYRLKLIIFSWFYLPHIRNILIEKVQQLKVLEVVQKQALYLQEA